MAISAAQAQAKLDALMTEYDVALKAYSVQGPDGTLITKQRLDTLLNQIQFWEGKVAEAGNGGIVMKGIETFDD